MSEVLIRADKVGKKFCRDLKRSLWYGVKDSAADLLGRGNHRDALRKDEFWANREISFEVKRGECLGLIGSNGAGKTTLLKMLSGLIKPDIGRCEMRGRIGAMIALGAGFNPVLTARENILVNGSILGLSRRQICDKLDEIVDFAEIHEFVDAPVRTFSSGMQVRLGFGIAGILICPDILLLDEVLAVGDMGFKIKCLNRVRELTCKSAVILVSHTMQSIGSFCTRVLLLKNGQVALDSEDVGTAIDHYNQLFPSIAGRSSSGNGNASLNHISMNPDGVIQNSPGDIAAEGSILTLCLEFEVHSGGPYYLILGVKTAADEPLMNCPCTNRDNELMEFGLGVHRVSVSLPLGDLVMGQYKTHLVIRDEYRVVALRIDGLTAFRVEAGEAAYGRIQRFARTTCLS